MSSSFFNSFIILNYFLILDHSQIFSLSSDLFIILNSLSSFLRFFSQCYETYMLLLLFIIIIKLRHLQQTCNRIMIQSFKLQKTQITKEFNQQNQNQALWFNNVRFQQSLQLFNKIWDLMIFYEISWDLQELTQQNWNQALWLDNIWSW